MTEKLSNVKQPFMDNGINQNENLKSMCYKTTIQMNLLNIVEIIPAEGDEGKNLGIISKDTANRKLIFEPWRKFKFFEEESG